MKLEAIYRKVIELGKKQDPRGIAEVNAELADRKKEFADLKGLKKELYDPERLKNPYADTRILFGNPNTEIKKIMVGIDIEGPEILLADRLRERGQGVDLAVSHHPEGLALARLADVMGMQSAIMAKYGVPINIAEDLMGGRIREIDRRVMPGNHRRNVDMAKTLGIPYMCIHTPADNHVASYLQGLFDKRKPRKVKDVMNILNEHEEYRKSGGGGAPVCVFVGDEERKAGNVFVDMTGGTEGSKDALEKLADAGVGTIVGMHMTEEHRKEAEKHHLNVVIAGHISSDSLGLNLLIDELVRIDPMKIIEVSGFIRVDRTGDSGLKSKKKGASRGRGGSAKRN